MSKIICDVCGTSFPDSANQCPICGCAAATDVQMVTPQDESENNAGHGTYTYVKGGRFSKANVKKRNKGKQTVKNEKAEKPEKVEKKKKSNVGLIIAAIALFLAIVAVALYITFTFFINPSKPKVDETPTTVPATQESTTAPITEPTVLEIPCEDMTCPISLELTEQGQQLQLEVTVLPVDTTDEINYVSSDDSIVTVDAGGMLTAVAPGEANIEITCGEKKAICEVTCVFDGTTEPENEETEDQETEETTNDATVTGEGSNQLLKDGEYSFNTFDHGPDFSLYPNNSHELVLRDKDNNIVEITITSQTPGVCTVDGNVVRAVAPGNATLIVRFGDGENDFFVCEVIVWQG